MNEQNQRLTPQPSKSEGRLVVNPRLSLYRRLSPILAAVSVALSAAGTCLFVPLLIWPQPKPVPVDLGLTLITYGILLMLVGFIAGILSWRERAGKIGMVIPALVLVLFVALTIVHIR